MGQFSTLIVIQWIINPSDGKYKEHLAGGVLWPDKEYLSLTFWKIPVTILPY